MSEKERASALLEMVPEYTIGCIIAFLQELIADEATDDAFCERTWGSYVNDPDPEKDVSCSLEECSRKWGLS